jgi:ADP-dependent phosphofructokinase/glucokinase
VFELKAKRWEAMDEKYLEVMKNRFWLTAELEVGGKAGIKSNIGLCSLGKKGGRRCVKFEI